MYYECGLQMRIRILASSYSHIPYSNILFLLVVSSTGTYDAYIMSSNHLDDWQIFEKLTRTLEKEYNLCIPDRDFAIGGGTL